MGKDLEQMINFKGVMERKVYDSDDFKVYGMRVNKNLYPDIKVNKYGNVSICGELIDLDGGVEYTIAAIPKETKYGTSYEVVNISRDELTTPEDIFEFLCGILTINQATEIFTKYPDIIQLVKNGRVKEIDVNNLKGIGEKSLDKIVNKIIENFCLADLIIEFKGYLSFTMLKRIYEKYTSVEMLKKKLRENPYKCLCSIASVGFSKADTLLIEMQANDVVEFEYDLKTSEYRCAACVKYLLQQNEEEGNTKANIIQIRKQCIKLVPSCCDKFPSAIQDSDIIYNKDTLMIALRSTYEKEKYIAETIIDNVETDNKWDFDVKKYKKVDGFDLSEEQLGGIKNLCKYNISMLIGAAGVGKSASTQAIINMLDDNGLSYSIFAPTGKAAKVIKGYTNRPASTVHRGLCYNPKTGWGLNKENKIDTDVVICDEFSMVDVDLFTHLIDAIDFKITRLLLIGDNAQLCSVGCGNLLHNFMEIDCIPTTVLTKVFRYSDGGLMKVATDTRLNRKYLTDDMKRQITTFGNNKDYTYIDLPPEMITNQVVGLYRKLLENGNKVEDIQILSSQKKGDLGTQKLNEIIQKVANKRYGSPMNITYGDTTYYIDDIVIQNVNNYKAHKCLKNGELRYTPEGKPIEVLIANGETGNICLIKNNMVVIDFDGELVRYTKENLKMIQLGYCITIHRSQGSSIKTVILITPQSHIYMLNSNLIYTGLTRMKEKCYHFGSVQTVNQAVMKKAHLKRDTNMVELMTKRIEENKNKSETH